MTTRRQMRRRRQPAETGIGRCPVCSFTTPTTSPAEALSMVLIHLETVHEPPGSRQAFNANLPPPAP